MEPRGASPWLLLLLLLALPGCSRGCRCPGLVPAPTGPGNNASAAGNPARRRMGPDAAVLVAVGAWAAAVLLAVRRLVRRSRAEERQHLRYLRALGPALPPRRHEDEDGEEEPLGTAL